MVKRIWKRFTSLLLSAAMLLSFFAAYPMTAYAATSGTLSGLSNADIGASYTGTDDGTNSSWSVTSGNAIKGSVIGTSGTCSSTQYNTTLTITNNKTVAAILSFDYAIALNDGTIQVAGTGVTANGSYSATIAAGGSIKVYLASGSTSNATTIDITNLTMIADVEATTTFQPAENGSYTVDGTAITEETAKTQQSTTAYSLSATADSGYKFVGWYSVTTGSYLSTAASASLYFDSDQTVTAVFVSEDIPVFDVAGARFFDLNEANQYAVSNGAEKISLVSDGTLTSGDYTISSGVILLIPFDEANTCYTTAPATTGNSRTAPSVFRTLTMAEGASISVNGAISVSAKHYAYGQSGAGAPDGKYGYIYMNEGSSITINNGGAMYVYGFVSGAGEVTAKSGATVYENMQIGDFRGGSTTSGMNNNSQKIFPINQYFVQNIEVKLTLESGADEYIYTSIYAASTSTSTAVHFIGNSGAMFSVSEGGYFAKEYLPDQDRLEVTVNGDARINSLTLTLMGISISSANYVLPINNCMTLNVVSGTTTITQDVALLAGSVVNISEGATVQITSGSSLYVYDQDEWTQANYASNAKFKRVLYSPTRTYTRTVNDLVDARIDVNGTLLSDGAVYTTAGGADITSSQGTGTFILTNGAGTNTATYMYKDYTTTYDTIPVNSAKLHNGSQYVGTDEEYTLTDGAGAGSTYYWSTSDSKWKLQGAAEEITITFDANGGTGTMDAQTTESGTDTVLTANVFTYEGYTFSGWNTTADGTGTAYADGATVNLSESTTLYAQWTPNVTSYTVTWVDEDGTVLETDENVAAGTMPEYNGETPTKAGDAQYSYTFSGWTPDVTEVTGDITYKAVYTQTVNQYTVTWKNWDGTVLQSGTVAYGETPVYTGEQPSREGDAEHTYTFAGWTPEITTVTGDAEYTATFTEGVSTYTVIWQDWDGTELERDENVAYGTTPEYNGETPSRTGDAQYSYTFTGWTPAVDTVTGNITYTATYSQTVNQYTITWMNGETVLKTEQVAYGETPVYSGETPVKEGDGQYGYTFTGWSPEIVPVTGDATYTAQFEQTIRTFTVTWKNWDGSVLETDTDVAYGATPEYNGETPTRAGDEQNTYTFTGWTPEISAVTSDITYTAVFETVGSNYTVTWVNEDGSVLEIDTDVAYGDMPEYNGETPTKAADESNSYTFSGWTPEISVVTGDITYTATFTANPIVRYTVTFDANGGEGAMEPQTFIQGVDTTLTLNTFTREGYQFIGWNTAADGSGVDYADGASLIALTGNITLYAQWQHGEGWFTDEIGTGYIRDGERIVGQWETIDGSTYYFKEDGYIAKGIYETVSQDGSETALFVFDDSTGIFLSDKSGLYDSGADTYWVENGTAIKDAGLVRVVLDSGEVNYYYFGEDGKAYKGTEEQTDYLVEKNNGLGLPAGINYPFEPNGVIRHFEDTSINGIYYDEASGNYYYCVDGVIIANGLMLVDGHYYYARTSSGAFVTSQTYWVTKTNGLLDEGIYTFNEQGQIVFPEETEKKNGIVEENGSLYYYVDGVITGAGLIQINGDYYYVRTSNAEVVHGRDYWVTVTNNLLPSGVYTFDESGKMVNPPSTDPSEPEPEVKNGIVEENGSLYYYVDGVRTAAGLIQIDGDYYYVKTSNCEVVHGRTYWVTVTNGLLPSGQYVFADDGKMIQE